ncbi:tRNA (adenosine(37)-N6)-threonylcarbamoyltransferase complex dimerization subunit type 1 TsaB [Candidatus Peregrinibacteria bacterium]|nr:tRNA (adenosine(37)-N6)-threonylcarbamoyltransferase complex dimerization subunit type 1 TsaB [Candidatus Peregrinibacteria bacterium]
MLILAINTASSITGIALFEFKKSLKILAKKSWPAQNNEAEKLMPAIDKLLSSKKSSLKFSDIQQIYVIKGPGSFTGLRVGITVANTIAYLTKAETFAPSTFKYWHSRSELPVLVYAGSGGVYFSKNDTKKPELINLPDLNKTLNSEKIKTITGDITLAQIKILKKIKFEKLKTDFATAMQKMIAKNMIEKFLPPQKLVKPLYVKEPNISTPKAKFPILN